MHTFSSTMTVDEVNNIAEEGAIVPKFDMHTFSSTMTVDEVNNIAEEYGIPLDLRPQVSSSTMTMNRVLANAIGIYEKYLEISSVKNAIDLRPVHPAMLHEISLTTRWKHVGYHPTFKDGEGNVAASMSQFLKFLMASGVRIGKGTALRENERPDSVGPSRQTKKQKTTPFSMALSESDADGSHKMVLELSIPPLLLILSFQEHVEVCSTGNGIHLFGGGNAQHRATGSTGRMFGSSSGGSGRHCFSSWNSGGDGCLWIPLSSHVSSGAFCSLLEFDNWFQS
ncbi:hypothetical protein Tco_1255301 [Tanacetum coccineum]